MTSPEYLVVPRVIGTALALPPDGGPLASLDEACRLLAQTRDLAEVRAIRNMAEAARLYARAIDRGLEAQNHAAEIKIRAERRAGELLTEMPKHPPGPDRLQPATELPPTYEDLGIEKTQAHRWQQIATIPEPRFEAHIEITRATPGRELSSAGVRALATEAERVERAQPPAPRPVSVVETDQEALLTLIGIHAVAEPRILDVTHNHGRMWQGLPYRPHRVDNNPELHALGFTDEVADFRALPFTDGSFDVIVFDPPHITDAGQNGLAGGAESGWAATYGTLSEGFKGNSIEPCFEPFLRGARRVLVQDSGIVLAKLANQVHGARYRDQARMFKNIAESVGFTHCDEQVKVSLSRGGLVDPRWKIVGHTRGVHSFWIVLRNGARCYAT